MEYPSSDKCEATDKLLMKSPIGLAKDTGTFDAATKGSPQIFLGDFAQATQDLLMEESSANRGAAARKLSKLGRSSATPYLIAALSDNSPEVRLAAAESLGHLGNSAVIAHLTDLLAREAHSEMEERIVSDAIHSIAAREGKVSATPPTIIGETHVNNGSLNSAHPAVDTTAQSNGSIGARTEPESFSSTLEQRLRSEGASPRQATENLEQRQAEAEQLHRAHDEKERLAALEANRRRAEQQTQQRNEKEQKLLAEIEALRKAEPEQRKRIEEANAAAGRRSAEESRTEAEIERAASRRAEEEEAQLAQLEAIRVAAESEPEVRATERQRLNAEIKTLSQAATEQIDRMDEAKARLAVLEQIRLYAETKVCERAEREIRLQAEIEALRQAEAAQLQRIAGAEAEARRLTEEQTQMQAADKARRKAEAEARQRAAAEALQQVEDEARRLAEEDEQRLEHLEAIRGKAEAAAQKRAEKEQLLSSQLLAFGEAAAEQLKRIEKAEADLSEAEEALQQFEEKARQTAEYVAIRLTEIETRRHAAAEELAHAEAEARALAEKEEQRLADLESLRSEAETRAQHRREQEQRLIAEIEALHEIEAEQLNRIADAEVALLAREEELQAAEVGVASSVLDALETSTPQNSTEEAGKSIDSVLSEEGTQAASEEIVTSWAERFRTGDPAEHANALQELARLDENDAFSLITGLFDDSSEEVRNAAARALYDLSTDRPKTFTRALREAPPERRRQIIRALDGSGLAAEAIDSLAGESREKTSEAVSMLFLMAKAGEVQSLLQTIEKHLSSPVRLSVIKLLTFSNRPDIIPALRSLAVRGALPIEVRSALMESIYEMSNARERSLSAA